MTFKFQLGAYKWIFLAFIVGAASAGLCYMFEITGPTANAIAFGISAGMMYATRDKWQA